MDILNACISVKTLKSINQFVQWLATISFFNIIALILLCLKQKDMHQPAITVMLFQYDPIVLPNAKEFLSPRKDKYKL